MAEHGHGHGGGHGEAPKPAHAPKKPTHEAKKPEAAHGKGHESAEHGGGKHNEWMKSAGESIKTAGVTVGIAAGGIGLLKLAGILFAPYMAWLGLGLSVGLLAWLRFDGGKKSGGASPAPHAAPAHGHH